MALAALAQASYRREYRRSFMSSVSVSRVIRLLRGVFRLGEGVRPPGHARLVTASLTWLSTNVTAIVRALRRSACAARAGAKCLSTTRWRAAGTTSS